MSTSQRNDARVIRVSTTQRAALREQTLEILELEHHRHGLGLGDRLQERR